MTASELYALFGALHPIERVRFLAMTVHDFETRDLLDELHDRFFAQGDDDEIVAFCDAIRSLLEDGPSDGNGSTEAAEALGVEP